MSKQAQTALHLIIHGRVQGVYYRDWTVANATRLGLTGWVRNLSDGTVEAVLAGEEKTVKTLLLACEDGPPDAHVTRIDSTLCAAPEAPGFEKKPDADAPD